MCPSCSGRMKILAALIKPGSVRAYLDGVGLPSRAPPIAPSRLDRQLEFDEPACSLRRFSRYPCAHAPRDCRNATLQHVVGMILPSPRAIDWRRASQFACQAGTRLTIMAPYRAYPPRERSRPHSEASGHTMDSSDSATTSQSVRTVPSTSWMRGGIGSRSSSQSDVKQPG